MAGGGDTSLDLSPTWLLVPCKKKGKQLPKTALLIFLYISLGIEMNDLILTEELTGWDPESFSWCLIIVLFVNDTILRVHNIVIGSKSVVLV